MIVYRILSSIVTLLCAFLAMITLFGFFIAIANPQVLFQCFLMAGVVLYGWFANRFFAQVIILKKTMSKKQKDWLQVNAIVAFVFSVMVGVSCVALLVNPEEVTELMKAFPAGTDLTTKALMNFATALLVVCGLLLVHVVWTYLLIRRNKMFFEN